MRYDRDLAEIWPRSQPISSRDLTEIWLRTVSACHDFHRCQHDACLNDPLVQQVIRHYHSVAKKCSLHTARAAGGEARRQRHPDAGDECGACSAGLAFACTRRAVQRSATRLVCGIRSTTMPARGWATRTAPSTVDTATISTARPSRRDIARCRGNMRDPLRFPRA